MKKFLFFAAVLMMAACGSKTGNNANGADSTVQDSVLTTETALSADETEADIQKTIEAQLQTVYAKLHEMDASGNGININELDQQFCSEEYRAEAKFRLTDKRGFKAHQHLVMLLENGQWKIHNWIDPEAFPEGNYLDWMKLFLSK